MIIMVSGIVYQCIFVTRLPKSMISRHKTKITIKMIYCTAAAVRYLADDLILDFD
jgi:hypothetical protein